MTEGEETGSAEESGSFVDGILDDLLPEGMEWRRMVRTYPIPALLLSGLGGFFLGSRHGTEILSALSSFATREVDRNISTFLGDE